MSSHPHAPPARLALVLLAGALFTVVTSACGDPMAEPEAKGIYPHAPGEARAPEIELGDLPGEFAVDRPPWRDPDIFPCSECHDEDMEPNPERRELDMAHEDIVLKHDEEHRWCLDCHDKDNRDKLRLASGVLIDFQESYRLCGQCHGDKYRDWRAGIHGRRTGFWNGKKEYLLCVHCHWPHAPRFQPLKPLPPPLPPRSIR